MLRGFYKRDRKAKKIGIGCDVDRIYSIIMNLI